MCDSMGGKEEEKCRFDRRLYLESWNRYRVLFMATWARAVHCTNNKESNTIRKVR
jgi:hypothetical protein